MAEGSGFRLPWVLPIEFGDYIGSGIELAIIRVIPVQIPVFIALLFNTVF